MKPEIAAEVSRERAPALRSSTRPCLEAAIGAKQDCFQETPRDDVNGSELQALEPKADKVAQLLMALGHSKRLMAMCRMMDDEVSVGVLAEEVGLGQSALSQHLSKLRALGLVTTRRDGQTIYYRLASPEARELISTLYRLYCA